MLSIFIGIIILVVILNPVIVLKSRTVFREVSLDSRTIELKSYVFLVSVVVVLRFVKEIT